MEVGCVVEYFFNVVAYFLTVEITLQLSPTMETSYPKLIPIPTKVLITYALSCAACICPMHVAIKGTHLNFMRVVTVCGALMLSGASLVRACVKHRQE